MTGKRPSVGLLSTIIGAALLFSGVARALPREKDRWFRLNAPHFVLFGNTPESTARTVAGELESLRATLALLKGEEAVLSPAPTTVYLFRGEKNFRDYRPESLPDVQGYFIPHPDGNFVALYNEGVERSMEVIFHEYIHYFVDNNMPRVPLWFGEGIAEFYSTFRSDGKEVTIGRMIQGHVALLRQKQLMPLSELFAVTPDSKTYKERKHGQGLFYAQCWALVHYLNNGDPELQPRLSDFLIRTLRDEPPLEAFRAAFGMDMAELEERLRRYIRRGKFSYTRLTLKRAHAEAALELSPMGRADTLIHLGDLLAHLHPVPAARAEEHFRAALALDPEKAAGYRGLGFLRMGQKGFDEARTLLEKSIALNRDDALTHRYLGQIDLERLLELTQGGMEKTAETASLLERAGAALETSRDLDPTRGESHALLGQVLFFREDCEQGPAVLKQALQMMPARSEIAELLSLLLSYCGQPDAARYVMDQFVRPVSGAEALESTDEALLFNEASSLTQRCFEKENCAAEIRRIKELGQSIRDPEMKRQVDEMLAVLEHNAAVRVFNRAIEAANAADYDTARQFLRQVVEQAADGELRKAAEELLEQLPPEAD